MAVHSDSEGKPTAFADFPAEAFPLKVTFFKGEEVVLELEVLPYVATEIPGLGPGACDRVRIEQADGVVYESTTEEDEPHGE